jgi:molecular chaperone GrpE
MCDSPKIIVPSDDEVEAYAGKSKADAPAAAAEEAPLSEPSPPAEPGPLAGLTDEQVRAMAAEAAEYKDAAQRAVAELANYRKRVQRDQPRAAALARRDILGPVVAALDELLKGLAAAEASAAADPAAAVTALEQGVRMSRDGLIRQLAAFGFTPIEGVGARFDPKIHEAAEMVDSDAAAGTVVEVRQEGYMLDDLLIRPSRVTVSRGK